MNEKKRQRPQSKQQRALAAGSAGGILGAIGGDYWCQFQWV